MTITTEKILTQPCVNYPDITIYVMHVKGEGYEVYYKRPEYPLMFAFGLPSVHHYADVFDIAQQNAELNQHLFK